jgi:hypothetical protein
LLWMAGVFADKCFHMRRSSWKSSVMVTNRVCCCCCRGGRRCCSEHPPRSRQRAGGTQISQISRSCSSSSLPSCRSVGRPLLCSGPRCRAEQSVCCC